VRERVKVSKIRERVKGVCEREKETEREMKERERERERES
jgi:hypothetical protein